METETKQRTQCTQQDRRIMCVWGEHVDKNDCNVRELMSNFRSSVKANRGDSRNTQPYVYADIYRYSTYVYMIYHNWCVCVCAGVSVCALRLVDFKF